MSIRILSSLMLTLCLSSAAFSNDRAGNAGEFRKIDFISMAYEALDMLHLLKHKVTLHPKLNLSRLENILRVLEVDYVKQASLKNKDRSAVNYPDEYLVEVTESEWKERKGDPEKLLHMVFHELLPFFEVNDSKYFHSTEIMRQLKAFNLLKLPVKAANSTKAEPLLLYSTYWDQQKEGISHKTAQNECRQYKQLYIKQFFFVYCEYLEKNWYEKTGKELIEWPIGDQPTYYKKNSTEKNKAFGLRVYGWADIEFSSWKVVGSSLGLANGLIDDTFDSEREAFRACHQRIRDSKDEKLRFYRAKCRSPRVPGTDKYYYEIVSQNPLIGEDL